MKNYLYIIILFTILFIVEAIGLYFIKKYSLVKDTEFLVISIISYALIPIFITYLLKENMGVGVINIIWNIFSIIYGLLIGVLIFKEKLVGIQLLGMILAVMGTTFILTGNKMKEIK